MKNIVKTLTLLLPQLQLPFYYSHEQPLYYFYLQRNHLQIATNLKRINLCKTSPLPITKVKHIELKLYMLNRFSRRKKKLINLSTRIFIYSKLLIVNQKQCIKSS